MPKITVLDFYMNFSVAIENFSSFGSEDFFNNNIEIVESEDKVSVFMNGKEKTFKNLCDEEKKKFPLLQNYKIADKIDRLIQYRMYVFLAKKTFQERFNYLDNIVKQITKKISTEIISGFPPELLYFMGFDWKSKGKKLGGEKSGEKSGEKVECENLNINFLGKLGLVNKSMANIITKKINIFYLPKLDIDIYEIRTLSSLPYKILKKFYSEENNYHCEEYESYGKFHTKETSKEILQIDSNFITEFKLENNSLDEIYKKTIELRHFLYILAINYQYFDFLVKHARFYSPYLAKMFLQKSSDETVVDINVGYLLKKTDTERWDVVEKILSNSNLGDDFIENTVCKHLKKEQLKPVIDKLKNRDNTYHLERLSTLENKLLEKGLLKGKTCQRKIKKGQRKGEKCGREIYVDGVCSYHLRKIKY